MTLEKYSKDGSESQKPKESYYIPVRYGLVFLLFWGTCVSFTLRMNMSLALVAMINKTQIRETEGDCSVPTDPWCLTINTSLPDALVDESACAVPGDRGNTTLNSEEGTFNWDSKKQGIILGSFAYGDAATQLLAGRLSDKLGPKWLIGGGALLGSILTSLVPLVAPLGVVPLVVLRVLTGMTQGCLGPSLVSLLNRWIPAQERTRMYSICTSGACLGVVICLPLVGILCDQTAFAGGWPSVFYSFGGTGAIWALLWMLLSSNDPNTHPTISFREKKYIMDNIPKMQNTAKAPDFPWIAVLSSVRVWAHFFAWVTSSWMLYVRITELPNYMDQVLHFPIKENGLINAIINLGPAIFIIVGSYVADYLIANDKMSKTNVRKSFESASLLGSSACLMLVTLSGCNHLAVISLLTLSGSFQGLASSGDGILGTDMAPTFSGTIYGFGNTFSNLGGFICPLVIGYILDMEGVTITNQWHYVFYLSTGLCVLGAVVVLTLWTAEVQPWDPTYKTHPDEHNCHDSCGCDDDHLVINEHSAKY